MSAGMPTPVGHAIGGVAAALLANSIAPHPYLSPRALVACAAAAVAPDLDLLVREHRTYTHSIGAVAVVAGVSWIVLRRFSTHPLAGAAAIASAYGSHLLLDWLGQDTSRPPGLMIFWPFSSTYFMSGYGLFGEVSRRYWRLDEFFIGNLQAVGWEVLVLLPVAMAAWIFWSGRTISRQSTVNSR